MVAAVHIDYTRRRSVWLTVDLCPDCVARDELHKGA